LICFLPPLADSFARTCSNESPNGETAPIESPPIANNSRRFKFIESKPKEFIPRQIQSEDSILPASFVTINAAVVRNRRYQNLAVVNVCLGGVDWARVIMSVAHQEEFRLSGLHAGQTQTSDVRLLNY
jgi:hypothetical protein